MTRFFTIEELESLLARRTPGKWTASHRDVRGTEDDDEFGSGLGLEIEGPERPTLRGDYAKSADAKLLAAAPDLAFQLLTLLKLAKDME